jgi:peptidoglycan/LPS O-acetylase OafA/YrhL
MTSFFKSKNTDSNESDDRSFQLLIPSDSTRSNNLDFLRLVLAISVVYCHCYILFYGSEEGVEPLWVASGKQLSIGTAALNFFFLISGFLIIQSWNNSNGFIDFLKKRILRVYPGYIVASLLCVLLLAPIGTRDWFMPYGYWKLYYEHINIPKVLFRMFELNKPAVPWTLKNAPYPGDINGPLWTIRYEFYCYLFIPLAAIAGFFRKKYFVLILFGISIVSHLLQQYENLSLFNWQEYMLIGKPDFFPRFLTYFLAGICFYNYRNIIPRSRILLVISLLMIPASTIIFKGLIFTLSFFGSYVLFYIAFSKAIPLENFAARGDFSYGVYIYAWPVQQLLILFLRKHLNIGLLFTLTMMITLVMAYLSWHFIEKPFKTERQKNLH